ncbi:MAG: type II toxin-antitoxin system HicA family toxin [Pyrinomonadaceae bacterium]|nr:type II toxin-antitoxin system HicA family toxin [Pyrinomonadaceae bacterium]
MGKFEKVLQRVRSGESDANIPFADLCLLLKRLGFKEHISGGHHNFRKEGVRKILTLQPEGNKAKRYQVRQVREIILEYGLGEES